jgi:hypothetical protein
MLKRSDLTRDTQRMFKEPSHILETDELTLADKIRVLENWQLDLVELQRASEENMAGYDGQGDVAERLRVVTEALELCQREAGDEDEGG